MIRLTRQSPTQPSRPSQPCINAGVWAAFAPAAIGNGTKQRGAVWVSTHPDKLARDLKG